MSGSDRTEMRRRTQTSTTHVPPSSSASSSTMFHMSPRDILRYRYHHGANLGSIFVLERWLSPHMFPYDLPSDKTSELEAVKAWVARIGIERTRKMWENHWSTGLEFSGMMQLRHLAKCTTVRLPIGYFTLPGRFSHGTPFACYSPVYANAWLHVVHLIERLEKASLGVLLVMHALPGGANGNDHSGTNSGVAELWTSDFYRELAVECIQFVAQQIRDHLPNVVGLQLANEAEHVPGVWEWYTHCINAVSAIDSSLPVYISDCWQPERALDFAAAKNQVAPVQCPVVVDAHVYRCFSENDKAKSPEMIIDDVRQYALAEVAPRKGNVVLRGAVQAVVGEYSCVLDEKSWLRTSAEDRTRLVRQFGRAQSSRFQNFTGGAYYWTFKQAWSNASEWNFLKKAEGRDAPIKPPPWLDRSGATLQRCSNQALNLGEVIEQQSFLEFTQFLRHRAPNGHGSFQSGWRRGFHDAQTFFGSPNIPGGRIGCLEIWVLKRLRECNLMGDSAEQYEHGLRRGVRDYEKLVNTTIASGGEAHS